MRLNGYRRKVVLITHMVAALGLLGVYNVLVVGSLYAATRDEAPAAHAVYAFLRFVTFSLDIPLAVVTLLSGLTLVLTSRWRIFGDRWLTAKLTLYLATATVGATLLGPSLDTMVDATETGNPGESATRWRPSTFAGLQVAMLLAAATLGVFKPGRRASRRASAASAAEPAR